MQQPFQFPKCILELEKRKGGRNRESEMQLELEALKQQGKVSNTQNENDQTMRTGGSWTNYTLRDRSQSDNEFEVFAQRVDRGIQSCLQNTINLFECIINNGLNSIKETLNRFMRFYVSAMNLEPYASSSNIQVDKTTFSSTNDITQCGDNLSEEIPEIPLHP